MTHADMVAKPGLKTASWLPAHHCNDHTMFPAEQSLHERPVHQLLAALFKPLPNPDTRFTMHHPFR